MQHILRKTFIQVIHTSAKRPGFNVTWPKKTNLQFIRSFRTKIEPSKPKIIFRFTLGSTLLLSNINVLNHNQVSNLKLPVLIDKNTNQTNIKDPSYLEKCINAIITSLKILLRCGFLCLIFSPILIFYPFSYLGERLNNFWWKISIYALELAGPVFIKLGQWASTRRDIFSEDICNRLSLLQYNVAPHSWSDTKNILNMSFGENWEYLFTDFNEQSKPIGSGCVAQVYRVHLNTELFKLIMTEKVDTKRFSFAKFFAKGSKISHYLERPELEVAVKVLHPGIKKKIRQDLLILHSFANCLETIFSCLKWLSLSDSIKVFDSFILSQVNLCHEASLLDKFRENFKNEPLVSFPTPLRPLVTENVLVETWEQGVPLTHCLLNKDHFKESFKKGIASIGMKTLLKMVFKDNLVHADLHPGNILVSLSEVDNVAPKIVILDCGLASSLSTEDFTHFHQVFKAVAIGNGAEVAKLFLDNSVSECSDPSSFTTHMEKIVDDARKATLTLSKLDVAGLLNNVFSLLTVHKVKLESNFLSVILAILVLEGLGKTLDPKMDILQQAIPYLIFK